MAHYMQSYVIDGQGECSGLVPEFQNGTALKGNFLENEPGFELG